MPNDLPVQIFEGKEYHLYKGAKYFSRGTKFLHRVVWAHYNGPIPKGHAIHHINHDRADNRIENLACMLKGEHQRHHMLEPERLAKSRETIKFAIAKAPAWHASPEGLEWHRQHAYNSLDKAWNKRVDAICSHCGKSYVRVDNGHKAFICSANCFAAARRKSGIDDETRVCKECGKDFRTNRYGHTVRCSISCATKCKNRERRMRKLMARLLANSVRSVTAKVLTPPGN